MKAARAEGREQNLRKEVRLGSSCPHRHLRALGKFRKLFLIRPGLNLEGEPQGESHLEWSTREALWGGGC